MNKKSVDCLRSRYIGKKVKTEQLCFRPISGDMSKEKSEKLTLYHQKGSKFQLNPNNSPHLNNDYFYSHTDQNSSPQSKNTEITLTAQTRSQQLSKTFSQTEQHSQAQIEELRIINTLNTKILHLQAQFTQIQTHYHTKISQLKNQLKFKTQQTQHLTLVLHQLMNQQKSATNQVDQLMRMLTDSSFRAQNHVLVNKQNQHKQSLVAVLPLNSKREEIHCEKPQTKINKMKASEIMFRKGNERRKEKSSRIIRSEEMVSKMKTRPIFTAATSGRNMETCKMKK